MAAHQRAPGLFVQRIETQPVLRVLGRLRVGTLRLEVRDDTRQHLLRTNAETFPLGIDPLARAVRKQIAAIETRCLEQCLPISRETATAGRLEVTQVHACSLDPPCQRARPGVDQRVECGPVLPEVMQLAAEIRQCLGIG